jgi:mxaJ protein
MCSRFLSLLVLLLPLMAAPAPLRVCADPNNLPFSNEQQQGFENRIALLLARDLGAKVEFVWWSERKSLVKNTLDENRCDVLMGVPPTLDTVAVTRPYYRSTYVFVSRQDRDLHLASLDDPRLEKWRIGIHVVGDDYAPPAIALGRRGLAANVTGYSLFGAYGEPNPPARLIDAVASGKIDLAIVWGPFAGYFAQHSQAALTVTPVSPSSYLAVPFVYDVAIGVRKTDDSLRSRLDTALQRNCAGVRAILDEFAVPQAPGEKGKQSCDDLQQSPAASWR